MPNRPDSGRASIEPVAFNGSDEVETPAARLLFALTAAGLLADGLAAPIFGGAPKRLDMLVMWREKRKKSRGDAEAIELLRRIPFNTLSIDLAWDGLVEASSADRLGRRKSGSKSGVLAGGTFFARST